MELESWEREPLWLKLITPILRKKRFPYLEGMPERDKWYRIPAEGCVAANGDPVYADFKLGSEKKLMIFFQGGGVSWNEYTAARPSSLYQKNIMDTYYMIQVDLFSDLALNKGIFENSERNPVNNWSMLVMPYATGDFHCGAGDFPYTAQDCSKRLCHHHGYINFRKIMETVTKLLPMPEKLLVCGCSGGGFAAALMTDAVMSIYPACHDVTCLVDSGFIPYEKWHDVAENVWHTPKEISNRIHSDNISLDALEALKADRKEVRILLSCSKRDCDLARMTNKFRHDSFAYSKESGEEFGLWLSDMAARIQKTIPDAGMYFFDIPSKAQKGMNLTVHCTIGDKNFYDTRTDGISCADWLKAALNGNIKSCGLNLLN